MNFSLVPSVVLADQSAADNEVAIAFQRLVALLELKRRTFDFPAMTRRGPCLFVGEGDLSFSLALARHPKSQAAHIVASTYESQRALSPSGRLNALALADTGAKVLHDIDARHLEDARLPSRAELIAFQFPNTGTRRSVHGRTDNHVLVRRFLNSARSRLTGSGLIVVTIVNNPHHLGAFDLPAAAQWAECEVIEVLPFYRSAWSGYGHVNTNNANESALGKYRSCSTWIFRPVGR
ncbi:DUF2431 domain-containing protein [Alkalicaulis satelles]|uniref:DUF2431 domain-containing protein n=1 Tax=Alkalicaulis satelles TaxID=2609175 RepID=A0A5M6ZGE0_9PROT|nr:Rossmann-like fold-containing protein [Alkalicaulis satelles]KAA5803325.1 DUF2431 domain-containing protein [Alkalicaulis satelles]